MVQALERKTFDKESFGQLIEVLKEAGYRTIGPRVRDGTIIYDDIASPSDLPAGYLDNQDAGIYRLEKTHSPALFGYTLSPQSWKRFLYPPQVRLWQARRNGTEIHIHADENEAHLTPPHFAFIGVRPCELRAIMIQDRVFLDHAYPDPTYQHLRENAFIVAVNCTRPAKTCFCASMETGPQATEPFDLALTEVVDKTHHYFVAEIGSERGANVIQQIAHHDTTTAEQKRAADLLSKAEKSMGRALKTKDLKDRLNQSYDHPAWDAVANRCLACGNCTMVCPTCFCTTVEDTTDLTGQNAERWRKWDSCFTLDFSYIFGGSVRNSVKARYRQWLTHKMATWCDQFDSMGCVGCGRCIAWCPVGIDITQVLDSIHSTEPVTTKPKRQRTDHVGS